MKAHLGLIELILMFAAVIGLAVWDLMATKRAAAAEPASEPAPKQAAKAKTGPRAADGKPRAKARSRTKAPPADQSA